jgi:beta-xylosidase
MALLSLNLYGELGPETIKFIDSITSFISTFKGRKPSYFTNRFYNNLSFIFANENTNIIKSYISKYGEFRIISNSIL